MSIQVKCPNKNCDQQLTLVPEMAGRKGQCPKCGKTFQIPKNLGAGRSSSEAASKSAGAAGQQKQKRSSGTASSPRSTPPRSTPTRSRQSRQSRQSQRSTPAGKRGSSRKSSSAGTSRRKPDEAMSADEFSNFLVADDAEVDESGELMEVEPIEEYDDYDEAGEYDAFEDDDDYRPRRRRRTRDEDDDWDDDAGRPMKSGMSQSKRWQLVSIGFLIVAIAMCVYGGSYALTLLAELFTEMGGSAKTRTLAQVGGNLIRIASLFAVFSSVALVTGYAFCLFTPNRYGSLGLIIAALSVGVVNMVLRLIFKLVPAFQYKLVYDRSLFAVTGGQFTDVGQELLLLFFELSAFAEIILMALFMAAVARIQKDRRHKNDCIRTVWLVGAAAGVFFVTLIFMTISFSDKWPVYFIRILNWAVNILLGIAMVLHIQNLFYSRRATE